MTEIDSEVLDAAATAMGPPFTTDAIAEIHRVVENAEEAVIEHLLLEALDAVPLDPRSPPGTLDPIPTIHLDAVRALRDRSVSVLVGPSGHKRSRILRIAAALQRAVTQRAGGTPHVLALAGTRLAASRMGADGTVHSALGWDPVTRTFERGPFSPLDADLVVVEDADLLDEATIVHLLASRGDAVVVLTRDSSACGSIPASILDVAMDPADDQHGEAA